MGNKKIKSIYFNFFLWVLICKYKRKRFDDNGTTKGEIIDCGEIQ